MRDTGDCPSSAVNLLVDGTENTFFIAEKTFFLNETMVSASDKIFSVTVTMVSVDEKIFAIMHKIFSITITMVGCDRHPIDG